MAVLNDIIYSLSISFKGLTEDQFIYKYLAFYSIMVLVLSGLAQHNT